MRHLDNLFEIGYIVPRIPDRFKVYRLGLVVNEAGKLGGIIAFDKFGGDAQTRQKYFELIIGPSVQVRRRDDIVARMGQGGKGHELGGLARGGGHGGSTSFQGGDALFEDIDRRLGGCASFSADGFTGVLFEVEDDLRS